MEPEKVRCFHWGNAEKYFYEQAWKRHIKYNHNTCKWFEPNWFNLLKVVQSEPIVVKGSFGFGLKEYANALYKQGLITTKWDTGEFCDGLDAMIKMWDMDKMAKETSLKIRDIPKFNNIRRYNEIDCKVLWDILNYFRNNLL